MKINNKIQNRKWKKFFKHEEKNIHCVHCKYTKAEDSIPKADFDVKVRKFPNSKTDFTTISKTITEIKLINGSDDDVIGWTF